MSALSLMYAAIVASCFASLSIAAYATFRTPVPAPRWLGVRGLARVRALRAYPLFASLEPALRAAGMQVRRVLGGSARAALDRRLMLAGDVLGLLPEELVAASVAAAGLVQLLGATYAFLTEQSLPYTPVAALLFGLLPSSRVDAIATERRIRVDHGLPPLIDLLVLSLSAGLDLPGALRQVVDKSSNAADPLVEELGFVLQELNMGKTRKAALEQLAERLPTISMRQFVATVIQAEEQGNPLARVLRVHAESSRRERSTRAEEAAAKAGVKMMGPLVMVFIAILLLIAAPMVLSASATF